MGRTREEAYQKTLIKLDSSGDEAQIAACGVAIVILFPFCCCALICASCVGAGGPAAVLVCLHCIWFIVGPIMLTSLARMQDTFNKNVEAAEEFVYFEDCADEYAHVNVAKLQKANESTLGEVNTLFGLSVSIFAIMALILVIPLIGLLCIGCLAICDVCCHGGASSVKVPKGAFLNFIRLMQKG